MFLSWVGDSVRQSGSGWDLGHSQGGLLPREAAGCITILQM
jgi:hypothetical protein